MKNDIEASSQSTKKMSNRAFHGKVKHLEIIYIETPNITQPTLFDYEQQNPTAKKIVLKTNLILGFSKQNKFCLLNEDADKSQKGRQALKNLGKIFGRFKCNQNYYEMSSVDEKIQRQLWMDVSSFPTQFFPIKKNDIIRLGRKIIKIRQMLNHKELIPLQFQNENLLFNQDVFYQNKQQSTSSFKQICRVCQVSGKKDNPLLTPCLCKQLQTFIHLNCLKNKLQSLMLIKAKNFSYNIKWAPFLCEKCKSKLKLNYNCQNKIVKAITLPRPDPPYFIFQYEQISSENIAQTFLQIVPMSEQHSLCIGKSSKAHIYFSDQISISKSHCQVTYDEESTKFLLTDLQSKYGTLMKVNGSLKIRPHHPGLRVQVGNSVLEMRSMRQQQKVNSIDLSHKVIDPQNKQILQQDSVFFI